MLWRALCALVSMLFRRQRMSGRSWQTEFTTRMVRRLFETSRAKPEGWLTSQFEKIPVAKTLLERVDISERDVAGIHCLEVAPKTLVSNAKTIVYLHGGGYVSGSPAGYRGILAQLAVATGCHVLAPDYRLSPKSPFPAAQNDCLMVVKAMLQEQQSVLVMGDSAGGALAITTTLALAGLHQTIDGLVLISPWVEPTASGGSIVSNQHNDVFDGSFLPKAYQSHLQDADPMNHQTNFKNTDLSDLPTTYIQAGAGEIFIDQIKEFQHRASEQAKAVSLDVFPAMPHVFQILVPGDEHSRDALKKIAKFVKSVL